MNTIIYDNQCSLCEKLKLFIEKIDFLKLFNWIHSINKDVKKKFSPTILDKTIILVTKDERIHTEFNACRYILSRIPFFWPILIFMYIPILSKYLGKIIYQTISKRRHC